MEGRYFKAKPLFHNGVEIGGEFEELTLPKPYYQDDAVTIYHGDCREILPLLTKVDLVLTDPPYGISLQSHGLLLASMDTIAGDADCQSYSWLDSLGVPLAAFLSSSSSTPD